ncbi:hypothetical protein [Enterovirga aerilata]|uniref:Uncharacterized protein n=1 Tax=Enterovirga aerilata TaxID=2730920 RepID=A0A849I7Q5_9HYPH|nr:hypothetical protein [Enterovirga sp. DB1703]NNM72439.1 hypothetical protein [Enterovirga sp. DB1703]
MSTSRQKRTVPEFETWLRKEFAEDGSFTALTVLVEIGETQVTPVSSTFFNVIGPDVSWAELVALFAGSGQKWDGAAFFPARDGDGDPLDNTMARIRLREVELRLGEDRLVLNEGHFFDKWGRRLQVEEMTRQ